MWKVVLWVLGAGMVLSLLGGSLAQPDISTPAGSGDRSSIQSQSTPQQSSTSSLRHTGQGYVNSRGNYVPSPAYSDTIPVGASAQCGDGTYSFSQSRRGTCSHHGGVARWL